MMIKMIKTIKMVVAAFAAVVILVGVSGCQLAIEDKGEVQSRDRLIGVFITEEYLDLFDTEKFLNDNAYKFYPGGTFKLDMDYSKYQKRLYATFVNQGAHKFVFEGIKGIPFYAAQIPPSENESSTIIVNGDAVCDVHLGTIQRDDEDSFTLEGTVYITPDTADTIYHFNPVYQSPDGRVYVVSGNSARIGHFEEEGSTFSKKLDEKVTVTENGKSKTVSSSVKVTMTVVLPPHKISVLEMDKDSNIISRTDYSPVEFPGTIAPSARTDYIIVESYSYDKEGKSGASRAVYDRKSNYLETFHSQDNGICMKQITDLKWNAR